MLEFLRDLPSVRQSTRPQTFTALVPLKLHLRHALTFATTSVVRPRTCSWRFCTCLASFGAPIRDGTPVVAHINLRISEKSIRLRPTHLPHWMTEAAQRSNGASPVKMTEHSEADKAKAAPETHAPKSTSPSKGKPAATSSEASAKTSKKRRKVNHGKPSMLCIPMVAADALTFDPSM